MKMATVILDYRALRNNLERLREIVPSSKLLGVIKANAYGHGLLDVARMLPDINAFGVARLEEAKYLRLHGVKQPILLLEGFIDVKDLLMIEKYCLYTVIHNEEQLHILEKTQLSQPVNVWMKLDIGMHRLGVRLEIADSFYTRLKRCRNVCHPINIISHLTHANQPQCIETDQQLEIFSTFCRSKPVARSIAASGGILFWPQSHFDWVRPGIILYGISPMESKFVGIDFGFQPVMSFISCLIAVRKHKAGEAVGYGSQWISKRDTYLGVVAVGYGDGYPRSAPSGTPVLINNREVPIVGSIAMDMICVDLGPQAPDKPGDQVVLWGREGLFVERIAQITGVSVYELVTGLTSRVVRNVFY